MGDVRLVWAKKPSRLEVEPLKRRITRGEFPNGYTSLRVTGYWKSKDAPATMREDSRFLVIPALASAKVNVRRSLSTGGFSIRRLC